MESLQRHLSLPMQLGVGLLTASLIMTIAGCAGSSAAGSVAPTNSTSAKAAPSAAATTVAAYCALFTKSMTAYSAAGRSSSSDAICSYRTSGILGLLSVEFFPDATIEFKRLSIINDQGTRITVAGRPGIVGDLDKLIIRDGRAILTFALTGPSLTGNRTVALETRIISGMFS